MMKTRVLHVSRLSRHNLPDTIRHVRLCDPCTNLARPHLPASQIHHLQHRMYLVNSHDNVVKYEPVLKVSSSGSAAS